MPESDPALLRARAAPTRRWSHELHPFNAFYGHDVVLKRYAELPARTSLKVAIEHGLTLDDVVPALDRRVALPAYLAQSDRRAAVVATAMPNIEVEAIGPMIRYAEALRPESPSAPGRRVVLFPAHSIDTAQAEFDVGDFLESTAEVRSEYDETIACLYWRDIQLGRDRDYREAGIGCTTAGHLRARDFLFRLLDVLRSASLMITNEPGTHLAYAVLLGVPVWLVPQRVDYAVTRQTPREVIEARSQSGAAERVAILRRLFGEPTRSLSPEQQAYVDELTGDHRVRTPENMRAILARAQSNFEHWPLRRRAGLHCERAARLAVDSVRAVTGAAR